MNVAAELSRSNPQGSVDKLNTFARFESENSLGIPTIPKETEVPDVLIPHKTRLNDQLSLEDEEFSTVRRLIKLWVLRNLGDEGELPIQSLQILPGGN